MGKTKITTALYSNAQVEYFKCAKFTNCEENPTQHKSYEIVSQTKWFAFLIPQVKHHVRFISINFTFQGKKNYVRIVVSNSTNRKSQ